ncbi:MAG: FtsQ-type POTRA domain-containing protein [Candidatus Rokubacteria bacterium]|nr:FtsQ-type POTRA domain-containing protein [Candidatus Rokubacteria bacterium]
MPLRGSSTVLSPRGRRAGTPVIEDLAERVPLIAGQRVRRGRRPRKGGRRRALRAVLVGLGVGLAMGGAAAGLGWLLTSPWFEVVEVEVRGQSRLDAETVVTASGIVRGTNLFRLDTRAAVAAIEALPPVRRAEVIRSWPDRVAILVEERRPFTLVHAGRLHWIDEQGVALGLEPRAVPTSTPVISGLEPEDLAAAERPASGRVASGLALLRTLLRAQSPLLAQISEIDVSRPEGPVLYTVDGVEVRLGREDWEGRLPRLQGVLAQVAQSGEGVVSIDLRFRDQVVLKPAVR